MKMFEVYVSPYNETMIYPLQKSVYFNIMVINKGDEPIEFNLQGRMPELDGTFRSFVIKAHPTLTPQWMFRLEPGESRPVTYLMSDQEEFGYGGERPVNRLSKLKGELVRTMIVKVVPIDDPPSAKSVTLKHIIRFASTEELENSKVQGYVYDENEKPLKDILVTLRGKSNVYRPSGTTNEDGFYSIKCHGQYPYQIETEENGYSWSHRNIEPPWLGPMSVDIHIKSNSKDKVEYDLIKKHDLNGRGCVGWMSKNEKYVFIGYKSGAQGGHGEEVKESYVHFFSIDGELLWKQPMKGAVWTVDISDDGTLASSAGIGLVDDIHHGEGQEIALFDRKGNVLWRKEGQHCRETRISHNKKYVAVQGNGYYFGPHDVYKSRHVYLLDAKNGNIIWKYDIAGMVRVIYFSRDDSKIYVFSGSGYLDTLNIEGNLLWRTYIGTWPENPKNVDITDDEELIAVSGHWGEISLIDNKGHILWSRCANGFVRGQTSIAPDKSYIMVASQGEYGLVKFDIQGNIMWRKDSSYCCKITQDSDHILYSSNKAYLQDRGGNVIWVSPVGDNIKFVEITKNKSRIILADDPGRVYFLKKD